jgi:hypothetical protein
MQTTKKPATAAETLEEEAHNQPKNTAINVEYPPRSNDKTLDDEACLRSRRSSQKCRS